MNNTRKKLTTKIALAMGILLLAVWGLLGAGASIAWFKDETPTLKNVFNVAEFDLDVQYKNSKMITYKPLEIDSNVFLEDALYEPGYTQVVYLKVKNNGTVNLKYKLSVDVQNYTPARGVLGNDIYLPDYLKYGAVFADSESVLDRELAQSYATKDMAELQFNSFTEYDNVTVGAKNERYIALIVFMPNTVGNAANYRGNTAPTVNLGLTVYAEQTK